MKCPVCKHEQEDSMFFSKQETYMRGRMTRVFVKPGGFSGVEHRQIAGCPECGVVFMVPSVLQQEQA